MNLKACPQCKWKCLGIVEIHEGVSTKYLVECQHCHWKGKRSRFKGLMVWKWNHKRGEFTVRRERYHA